MTRYHRSTQDPLGTGMAIRAARALPVSERPAVIHAIAERVAARYRTVLEAGQSLQDVGGWSSLIALELGTAPDPEPNEIGIANNDAFWRWTVLRGAQQDIRNQAVAIVNGWGK